MHNLTLSSRPASAARRRVTIGVLAGAALAVGAPLAASAHVHVDPGSAAAGASTTLSFAFSHGCDGSATTALAIDIPEGVGNATPIVQGGWTITRELGSDGVPTRVVYTAGTPVEDGLKASVSMDVLFTEAAAGTTVAFPVTQACESGATAWTEIAEGGQDPHDLEAPAPVVEVGPAADEGEPHASAPADAHADHDDAASEAAASAEASGTSADPVARWLAAGALGAGIAALAVALTRGRSRKG